MKTYFSHRFASVMSFAALTAMALLTAACVAGSSRNINVADVPGQTPGPTIPKMVEPLAFDRGKESYRVYSVILNHKWERGNIVVRDHTGRGLFQNDEWLDTNVGKSHPEEVTDFNKANEKDVQLENQLDYSGKFSLISEQEFKKTIGGGDGWDLFRKGHPDATGVVTFSAVGFDRNGSHAVVNLSYLCAAHCGNGTVYILEKKNGEWAVSQEIGTWMS
jgi:hypothetical protein